MLSMLPRLMQQMLAASAAVRRTCPLNASPPHPIPPSCRPHRPNLRLHHPRVRPHTLPPVQYCNILGSYYLYGRSLKRAFIMFPYMISKGVVEIVVAATLLDKVHISPTNKTLTPFATPPQHLLR